MIAITAEIRAFIDKAAAGVELAEDCLLYTSRNDPRLHPERRHCPCGDHAACPRPAGICSEITNTQA